MREAGAREAGPEGVAEALWVVMGRLMACPEMTERCVDSWERERKRL